jgi:hypothetical protein
MTFKRLPNGKWKYIKEVARGKLNPDDPDYDKKIKHKFKKTELYCDICKAKYNLADPCIHHLSDSPEHRARYKELKKKQEKIKSIEKNIQQRFK